MTAIAVPAEGRGGGGPTLAVRMLGNETLKGLQLLWRRRAMLIVGIALNGLTYLGIRLFIGGGHIVHPLLTVTLPGLLAYAVAGTAAVQGSGGIAEEINGGTLEQAQLSPARPSLLAAGRLGALAIEGLIVAIVLGAGFVLTFGVHYHLRPDALVPAVLTVADGLGYALLITALTLAVASIGAITHVFNMTVMFFNGMLVPITVFPHGAQVFEKFLPTTLGVQALNTTLAGRPLSAAWADGTLPWLLVHATVLLGLGWATYLYTIRRARREGGLSPR